jgi:hypothetical protein
LAFPLSAACLPSAQNSDQSTAAPMFITRIIALVALPAYLWRACEDRHDKCIEHIGREAQFIDGHVIKGMADLSRVAAP